MLTSERKRVVLDTNIIIRGLRAKKENKKESFSYKILRQFESNHCKLMMNSKIREEYDRKLNKNVKEGKIDAVDAHHFLILSASDKAHYDRIYITPLIDVVNDPSDNIFFMSNNCLTANYLITANSKHLNNNIKADLKKLGSGLLIVNQAEFLGEKIKFKVYVSHPTAFNYKDKLYVPLKDSKLNENYNFILPHENSNRLFDSKGILPTCDLILAEVSIPSTGQGIELGWANTKNIHIICIYKKGAKFSDSLKSVSKVFIEYETEENMIEKLIEYLPKIL